MSGGAGVNGEVIGLVEMGVNSKRDGIRSYVWILVLMQCEGVIGEESCRNCSLRIADKTKRLVIGYPR